MKIKKTKGRNLQQGVFCPGSCSGQHVGDGRRWGTNRTAHILLFSHFLLFPQMVCTSRFSPPSPQLSVVQLYKISSDVNSIFLPAQRSSDQPIGSRHCSEGRFCLCGLQTTAKTELLKSQPGLTLRSEFGPSGNYAGISC